MGIQQSLDFNWHFHLGDISGAENPAYNDTTWRSLNVPHDWSVEGEYSEDHPTGWQGGYLPCGIGWYRRELQWNNAWTDKRVEIQFVGIYMNSDVWVNGTHLGNRPYGYSSFKYDLTPHLNQNQNIIAVRIDHENARSGRWYTGSGIYRHVWLNVSDPLYLDPWQTFITTPKISDSHIHLAHFASKAKPTELLLQPNQSPLPSQQQTFASHQIKHSAKPTRRTLYI